MGYNMLQTFHRPGSTRCVRRASLALLVLIACWITSCTGPAVRSNLPNNTPPRPQASPATVTSPRDAINNNPADARSWFSLGKMYFKERKYNGAVRSFRKAIEMGLTGPEKEQAHDMLGWSYYKMGEYDRAVRVFDKALKLFPRWSKALIGRACAYRQKGQHHKALAEFASILSLHPDNLTALDNRGWTYYQIKDYERALSDFKKAESLSRSYPALRSNVLSGQGWCYYMKGDFEIALAKFEKAARIAPPRYSYGVWDAYRGMAFSEAGLGNFDSSYMLINKANSAMNYDTNHDLAVLHYAAGDKERTWHFLGGPGYAGVSLRVVNVEGIDILYVAEIDKGGPADMAGIVPGDIISGVEGKPVKDLDSFARTIKSAQPGARLNLIVSRQGVDRKVSIVIQDASRLIESDPLLRPIIQHQSRNLDLELRTANKQWRFSP